MTKRAFGLSRCRKWEKTDIRDLHQRLIAACMPLSRAYRLPVERGGPISRVSPLCSLRSLRSEPNVATTHNRLMKYTMRDRGSEQPLGAANRKRELGTRADGSAFRSVKHHQLSPWRKANP